MWKESREKLQNDLISITRLPIRLEAIISKYAFGLLTTLVVTSSTAQCQKRDTWEKGLNNCMPDEIFSELTGILFLGERCKTKTINIMRNWEFTQTTQ
jgi:hypothetical protein